MSNEQRVVIDVHKAIEQAQTSPSAVVRKVTGLADTIVKLGATLVHVAQALDNVHRANTGGIEVANCTSELEALELAFKALMEVTGHASMLTQIGTSAAMMQGGLEMGRNELDGGLCMIICSQLAVAIEGPMVTGLEELDKVGKSLRDTSVANKPRELPPELAAMMGIMLARSFKKR